MPIPDLKDGAFYEKTDSDFPKSHCEAQTGGERTRGMPGLTACGRALKARA